jgi:hypothetical protein
MIDGQRHNDELPAANLVHCVPGFSINWQLTTGNWQLATDHCLKLCFR